MPNLGATELLIILGIIILIFGASRLPEVGRGLGQSIRGFRRALADEDSQESALVLTAVQEEAEEEPLMD
jgi:sec-independent protein translocase protein TatA